MSPQNRLELLKKFLEENPDDPFTFYAIGLEYLKLNNIVMAVDSFQTCLIKDKCYLPVYYQLGKSLEKLNRQAESQKLYEEGMELAKKKKDHHTFNELSSAYDELV